MSYYPHVFDIAYKDLKDFSFQNFKNGYYSSYCWIYFSL